MDHNESSPVTSGSQTPTVPVGSGWGQMGPGFNVPWGQLMGMMAGASGGMQGGEPGGYVVGDVGWGAGERRAVSANFRFFFFLKTYIYASLVSFSFAPLFLTSFLSL